MSELYCPTCKVIWSHETSCGTRINSFSCPRCAEQCVPPPAVWPTVTHRVEVTGQRVGKPDTFANTRKRVGKPDTFANTRSRR